MLGKTIVIQNGRRSSDDVVCRRYHLALVSIIGFQDRIAHLLEGKKPIARLDFGEAYLEVDLRIGFNWSDIHDTIIEAVSEVLDWPLTSVIVMSYADWAARNSSDFITPVKQDKPLSWLEYIAGPLLHPQRSSN